MTPAALAALKALAEGATPGPWSHRTSEDPTGTGEVESFVKAGLGTGRTVIVVAGIDHADARYIAAASPDVVLALVARIEALELDRGAYDNWIGIYAKAAGLPYDAGPDDIKAAIERLRATVGDAVSAGLALEEAYEMAQRQRHNYEDWGDEQWDPIQEARNRLCAFNEKTGGKP